MFIKFHTTSSTFSFLVNVIKHFLFSIFEYFFFFIFKPSYNETLQTLKSFFLSSFPFFLFYKFCIQLLSWTEKSKVPEIISMRDRSWDDDPGPKKMKWRFKIALYFTHFFNPFSNEEFSSVKSCILCVCFQCEIYQDQRFQRLNSSMRGMK